MTQQKIEKRIVLKLVDERTDEVLSEVSMATEYLDSERMDVLDSLYACGKSVAYDTMKNPNRNSAVSVKLFANSPGM